MRIKQQLLTVTAAFQQALGKPESHVSKRLFGSGNRLTSIRLGSDAQSGTIEDALQKLSDQWPEGVAWPELVPRPEPSPPRLPEPAAHPADVSSDV